MWEKNLSVGNLRPIGDEDLKRKLRRKLDYSSIMSEFQVDSPEVVEVAENDLFHERTSAMLALYSAVEVVPKHTVCSGIKTFKYDK